MKRILSCVLAILMLLGLAACGGGGAAEPDPNAGVYEAVSARAFGISIDVEEVFPDGLSLTLKDGGKASFRYEGRDYSMSWTLEGEAFHAKGIGVEVSGTLSGGVMVLQNVLDSGIDITLVCKELAEGAPAPEESEPAPAEESASPAPEEQPAEETAGEEAGDPSVLFGQWRHESGYTYVFREDGTGAYQHNGDEMTLTYEVRGGKLLILFTGSTSPMEMPFTVEGDTLTLIDHFGSEVVYVRCQEEPVLWAFETFPTFDAEQARAMSSWINFGENYIEDDVFWGAFFLYGDSRKQFVTFDLVHEGTTLKAANWRVLDSKYFPTDLQRVGDSFYYLMSSSGKDVGPHGIARIKADGSDRQVLYKGKCDFMSIAGDRIYFTVDDQKLVSTDLDGGDMQTVLEKELYYVYCLNEDWLLYQDDNDNECLCLYYLPGKYEIKLNDEASYEPQLCGQSLYYLTPYGGDKRYCYHFSRIDLSRWEPVFDPELGCQVPRFTPEHSELLMGSVFFVDGTYLYPSNNCSAKQLADWLFLEDSGYDGVNRYYQYMDDDYQVELIMAGDLISAVRFHDRHSNYGNNIPWLY